MNLFMRKKPYTFRKLQATANAALPCLVGCAALIRQKFVEVFRAQICVFVEKAKDPRALPRKHRVIRFRCASHTGHIPNLCTHTNGHRKKPNRPRSRSRNQAALMAASVNRCN